MIENRANIGWALQWYEIGLSPHDYHTLRSAHAAEHRHVHQWKEAINLIGWWWIRQICIKTVRGSLWFYLATMFNSREKLIFAGKEVPDLRFFSIAFLIFLSKIYQNMGTLILVLRWNSRIETYTQKSFVAKYAKCEGTNIFLSQWHFCVK